MDTILKLAASASPSFYFLSKNFYTNKKYLYESLVKVKHEGNRLPVHLYELAEKPLLVSKKIWVYDTEFPDYAPSILLTNTWKESYRQILATTNESLYLPEITQDKINNFFKEYNSKNMENIFIEVLNQAHGKEVVEYFKSLGVQINETVTFFTRENNNTTNYYGVLNGKFMNCDLKTVQDYNASVKTLPISTTRRKLFSIYNIDTCNEFNEEISKLLKNSSLLREDEKIYINEKLINRITSCTNKQLDLLSSIGIYLPVNYNKLKIGSIVCLHEEELKGTKFNPKDTFDIVLIDSKYYIDREGHFNFCPYSCLYTFHQNGDYFAIYSDKISSISKVIKY